MLANVLNHVWAVLAGATAIIAMAAAVINLRISAAKRAHQRAKIEAATGRLTGATAAVLLPTRLPHLIDRSEVLDQACDRISAGDRLLTFEGDVGVGKSAVATELAHRLQSGVDDRIGNLTNCDYLWVDCRERIPTLTDICRQLTLLTGDQSLSAVSEDRKLDALRAHLALKGTVLLFDDLRVIQAPSSGPLLQLLRTVPNRSLIIASVNSSQAPPPATRLLLEELSPTHVREFIEYEADRLGVVCQGVLDTELINRLQSAVGGNTRLIESFLNAVAISPKSVEDLISSLERGEESGELFMPLWAQLSPDARDVLAACAYLRGQAIADQLRVACATKPEVVASSLDELVRLRVVGVVREAKRPEVYACSLAVQKFVIAAISPERIDEITSRLSTYYVNQLGSEPENAEWAVPHIAGVKGVLQWMFDRGDDAGVALLFASVLDILFTLGLFDDRILTGRLAYESAMRSENHRAASLASDVLSSTYAARGEDRAAREALALGLLAAERSGDAGERARQMRAHGLVLYKAGNAVEALSAIEGADTLASATGELETLANILSVRTVAHWYLGHVDESAAAAADDLRVCQEMGWQRAVAYPLRNLAEIAMHRGRLDNARALLDQARDVAAAHADRRQMARIHLTGARLALFSGDLRVCWQQAATAHDEAASLGLGPELIETRAIMKLATRARWLPLLRFWYLRRRPLRFTGAAVGN